MGRDRSAGDTTSHRGLGAAPERSARHRPARSRPPRLLAGLAFRLAASLAAWPILTQVLFFVGACIAVTSFLALGENFAVLPALRGVVSRGPYAYMRHPAYAGELVMMLACLLSKPSPMALAVLLTAVPFVGLGILTEERLLEEVETYRDYA